MSIYTEKISVKIKNEEHTVIPHWKCGKCNNPMVFRENCPNCHTDHHLKRIVMYG